MTDATDDEDRKSKKKIRRELSTEFVVCWPTKKENETCCSK